MIDLILDTDIGMDCDDAAALALLLNLQKRGECNILAVTASTAREGATAAIRTICERYGCAVPPMGRLSEPLAIDGIKDNTYALDCKKQYGYDDVDTDATECLRSVLAGADGKVALVAIGPLTNIANLLKSGRDDISPLSGRELAAQKVERLYAMAGCFVDGAMIPDQTDSRHAEFNVVQDIAAAQYVADNYPGEIVFSPFEIGKKIFTHMGYDDNPVWFCMRTLAQKWNIPHEDGFSRESWDPITCMLPFEQFDDMFTLSVAGTVRVDDTGKTYFTEDRSGKHRYLIENEYLSEIEDTVNALVKIEE